MSLELTTDWLIVGALVVFLIALNGFLMWANHETRTENRRLRRRLLADPERLPGYLLDEIRGGGEPR